MSYMCPDMDCKFNKQERNEGYCPECGAKLKKVGFREALRLATDKKDGSDVRLEKQEKKERKELEKAEKQRVKELEKAEKRLNKLLFHDQTPDPELKRSIEDDMLNLSAHEAGSAWMRAGTLLSFNSRDQMVGAGFKALIDQQKVLIKQNEQILRELKKLNSEKSPYPGELK